MDSPTKVKVEWLSYEGAWDSYADVTQMRPTQYASPSGASIVPGSACQVKLFQKTSYCWVDAVVDKLVDGGRIQVKLVKPDSGFGACKAETQALGMVETVQVLRSALHITQNKKK